MMSVNWRRKYGDSARRQTELRTLGGSPILTTGRSVRGPAGDCSPWKDPEQYRKELRAGKYEWSTVSNWADRVSSALRRLTEPSSRRGVRQAGVVVWQDAIASIPRSLDRCAPQACMSRCSRSWYALRLEVEDLLAAGEAPQLVVVRVVSPPVDDPLAEIRAAGKEFKRRLPTLVRNALTGQLAAPRIEQIAREARTLEEAEAALGGSTPPVCGLFRCSVWRCNTDGERSPAWEKDDAITFRGAWADVAAMLTSIQRHRRLRRSAARRIGSTGRALPTSLGVGGVTTRRVDRLLGSHRQSISVPHPISFRSGDMCRT